MRIIVETAAEEMPPILDAAWRDPTTFALLPARTPVSNAWVRAGLEQLPPSMQSDHFALLSSGSTGHPTLVIGSRTRAERLARTLHIQQQSDPVLTTPLSLPLSYSYAFVNQWLWATVHDRQLVAGGGFQYPGVLEQTLMGAENAMLCLVGAQASLLVKFFEGMSFPGVIRLHFAGGPFPGHRLDAIRRLFPNAIVFNNYGCVEAMPRLTIRVIGTSHEPTDIGRPIPGVELKTDSEGNLLFRSPFGAVAFYDDDGIRLVGDSQYIATGDRGERADDGSWRLIGRNNEIFKRYGEKIALPGLLKTVFGVWRGSAAFYRETDGFGEAAHVLVLAPTPDDGDLRSVLQAFRKNYPRTHWPLRVESLESLPLKENGKVDVNALTTHRDRYVHWSQRIESCQTSTS
jgi:acyl-CoA synthetase (AMP-forming)/AMP-acid ligase II